MREILFRGKNTFDGHWVHGLLISIGDELSMIVSDNGLNRAYPVSSETVGQYTRLTDKNGKKIFEGDIIKICGQHSRFDKVEFLDGLAGFYAVNDDIHIPAELATLKKNFIEVIGNIHDNPEMLEVAE